MKPFRADYHTHCCFSPDTGGTLPTQNIDAALAKGLDALMFTDHCECNTHTGTCPFPKPWPDMDYEHYFEYCSSLKGKYPIQLGVGIEIGQPLQGLEYAEKMVSVKPWDMILASNHNIVGEPDFCLMEYEGRDLDDICNRYFAELYDIVKWGKFDVLSHLYYFIKYISVKNLPEIDFTRFNDAISEIFKLLIQTGKGLEVNTSCMPIKQYGKPVPNLVHLKMYRELGGELITIGSDSHKGADIGTGIDETIEFLKEAGFRYVASYEDRKPTLRPIA